MGDKAYLTVSFVDENDWVGEIEFSYNGVVIPHIVSRSAEYDVILELTEKIDILDLKNVYKSNVQLCNSWIRIISRYINIG